MHPKSQLCERARAWASLRTDGELSELESALLDAHLGRCEPCRTFAQDTEAVATTLRAAHLERPAPLVLVSGRSRRNGVRALRLASAVAAVVAVGIAGALSGPSGSAGAAKPVSMVASVDSPDRLRQLRRPGLIEQGRPAVLPRNRLVPGETV
jgi:predicted anti-sigma-YlaC factor YlaD